MAEAVRTAANTETAISPMLSVRRGTQALEFYKKAFDARELFRIENDKKEIVARLAIGDAEFWISDESPEYKNFSPETLGGGTVRMILVVSDPDAIHARAIAAGAIEVHPVEEQHGWREGRIVDPFGHHWEIAKELK